MKSGGLFAGYGGLEAVWWIPKHVRDALIQSREETSSDPVPVVEGGESPIGVCEESDGDPLVPGELFQPGNALTYEGRRLVDPDRSVVDEYHRVATSTAGTFWCRNENCRHLAPGPGEPCPVCKDQGWKAIEMGGGAE